MATKTKLRQAVEERAARLNAVQRELVMAQLREYERNCRRISAIDDALAAKQPHHPAGSDAMKEQLARKMTLDNERAKLVSVNSDITEKLFGFMEDDD